MLEALAATGIGTAVFHRALVAQEELTANSIKQAEWITEIELSDDQREEILRLVKRNTMQMKRLRELELTADVPMAIEFRPTSAFGEVNSLERNAQPSEAVVIELPASEEEIAFLPVHRLSWLVRTQKITSVELTKIYLSRLKKYGDMLHCVVNLTEELAMEQASKADSEIQSGRYRGPLHGIPWGAKDLIAIEGYPTTWGIPYCEQRELPYTATVAKRLEEAGAVLVAKLSLGALAQGDKWFRGMTRSPWNIKQGSSGSSAGSASATVGGLVGFSLGSETLGSIVSPSIRCGASALRPTFGRVSRYGCMPLSWSLDKIGPICRSLEDCALVFDAIHGADGKDRTTGTYAFQWPSQQSLNELKIGYVKSSRRPDDQRDDLKPLQELGCELVEIELPRDIPLSPLTSIISIEAASVFDQLLRDGHTEGWNRWDKDFRSAQYISAVDYVRIQRTRSLLMEKFEEAVADVDFWINANDLLHTNFTGHPSVVVPIGYSEKDGVKRPRTSVISGHLNQDERLLAFADRYQSKLDAHLQHPDLERWLADPE